ncbi:MAG: type III-A CRISPR-associated RAMP protein Csm3 [Candidatus Competibacteraceae bacterium]|nr:type III-A CRISPR-associated RAMP protein Csm3 [Candidatus Competibacteraceae bacterium]
MGDTTNSANRPIQSKIFIRGKLVALTGLHIGGNSVGMAIGGADAVVVRNPLTNEPYVPGSSLRGKMRSLLERVRGQEGVNQNLEGGFSVGKNGALAGKDASTSLGKLFGVAAENAKEPTRLIVRDAPLTRSSSEALKKAPNTDMPMTEVKTEVWIDRITSQANPRQIERVPAGAEFRFELVLTLLQGDDKEHFLKLVFEGLRLVEADALGGKGTRGYGRVKFRVDELAERTVEDYRKGQDGKPFTGYSIPTEFDAASLELALT